MQTFKTMETAHFSLSTSPSLQNMTVTCVPNRSLGYLQTINKALSVKYPDKFDKTEKTHPTDLYSNGLPSSFDSFRFKVREYLLSPSVVYK